MVKHLISLRVHLSTTNIAWIDEFVHGNGMDALGRVLTGLVGENPSRHKLLTDTQQTVVLEIIRCLRVLLNTPVRVSKHSSIPLLIPFVQSGFDCVLASPTLVNHITYTLSIPSPRLYTLAAEVLAAICVLSITEGYRLVLSAMSEFRIVFDETFRFQCLVSLLQFSVHDGEKILESDSLWDGRTAILALINALTNCSDDVEERVMLRDEFTRRGLNEAIVVRASFFV